MLGVIDQFQDFENFFVELHEHFADDRGWILYPETVETLIKWQELDIKLGIISDTLLFYLPIPIV